MGITEPRVVVMGVSAAGKSTIGVLLSRELGTPFHDADALHPESNVAKMAAGTPLTDADRLPWLVRVGRHLNDARGGEVIACSALKRSYRKIILQHAPDTKFIHLHGSPERLHRRAEARSDHFMPAALLDSQLRTLEPLEDAEPGFTVNLALQPSEIVRASLAWLSGTSAEAGDEAISERAEQDGRSPRRPAS